MREKRGKDNDVAIPARKEKEGRDRLTHPSCTRATNVVENQMTIGPDKLHEVPVEPVLITT